jgi:CRISPR-associated protein Cmr2
MSTPSPDATFWQRKLAAFLHDSPDKVLDILDHENRARRIAGEIPPDERSRKETDWAASAADRLPFPPSRDTLTPLTRFLHPLGGVGAQVPLNESRFHTLSLRHLCSTPDQRRLLSPGSPRSEIIDLRSRRL